MDAKLYVQVLEDELMASLGYYRDTPDKMVFQQDNNPKTPVN